MPGLRTMIAGVGAVGLVVAGASAIEWGGESPEGESAGVIAHYEGRPGVPINDTIDTLTHFGNLDVALYDDGHATLEIIGLGNKAFIVGQMACNPDHSLHITAEPTDLAFGADQHLPTLDVNNASTYSTTACAAGSLTIASMDAAGGFVRKFS